MRKNHAIFDGARQATEATWPQKPAKSSPLRDRRDGSNDQSPIRMERGAAIMPGEAVAVTKKSRSPKAGKADKAVHFVATPLALRNPRKSEAAVQADGMVSDSSLAPQLSLEGRDELERRLLEISADKLALDRFESTQEVGEPMARDVRVLGRHAASSGQILVKVPSADKLAVAETMGRHRPEYERLKGSAAMGQLLKADEAVLKRQRKVSGALRR